MDAAETWPPRDPLGEALHYLRMDGAFYCRSELTAPWGMTLDPMPGYLWFHVVTTGAVLLEVDTENEMWLHPGAVSLVPHGEGHVLRSEPGAPAPGVMELELEHPSDRYEIIRHGGGGAKTILICGAVRFDHPAARNLVGILPQVIHIDASDGPRASLDAACSRAHGGRGQGVPSWRRGRDHATGRRPRDPGDPRLDRDRPGSADRLARRVAGSADRPRARAHPP